jgi:hypothetical protein
MDALITQEITIKPIPEPTDVAKRELNYTLDGVKQTPIDEPNGKPFEVVAKHDQEFEGTVTDYSASGVASAPSDPIRFKIVDDIPPEKPERPGIGKKGKKFKAV